MGEACARQPLYSAIRFARIVQDDFFWSLLHSVSTASADRYLRAECNPRIGFIRLLYPGIALGIMRASAADLADRHDPQG